MFGGIFAAEVAIKLPKGDLERECAVGGAVRHEADRMAAKTISQ